MTIATREAVLIALPDQLAAGAVGLLAARGWSTRALAAVADFAPDAAAPDAVIIGTAPNRSLAGFLDLAPEEWWLAVESHLGEIFAVLRRAALILRPARAGRIVLLIDDRGLMAAADASVQSVVGAAAIAMTKSLARELAPGGIGVNAIAYSAHPPIAVEQVAAVAETITFLSNHRLPSLVGQIIACNSGRTRSRA